MNGPRLGLALAQRGGGYDPVSLFPGSTFGALYEVGPGTVWRDAAGSLPAVPGDPVGMLADRSGNANHAVQANMAAQPLLKQDGGGRWYLEFDGVDDFLRAAAPMTQPWERMTALRQLTWGNGRHLLGGGFGAYGVLQQNGVSANLRLYNGTLTMVANPAPVLGANEVICEVHNGASSSIAVNDGAPVVTDYGPSAATGITIGASTSGGQWTSLWLYALAMRPGPLTETQRARLRDWLAARAGIAIG